MRALALVVALAACWTERAPRPPRGSGTPVPGTLWVTPAQPWRVRLPVKAMAVAGATAMVSDGGAWVARLDLARGAVVRERTLPDFTIEQLVALPGGRWLLVGLKGERPIAAALDAETLEPAIVAMARGDMDDPAGAKLVGSVLAFRSPAGAVVLDEGVAIALDGLPLAIYDPATWKVRRVVDPAIGWTHALGQGKTLYAASAGERGLVRFDLATGASEEVLSREQVHGSSLAGAAAGYLATWYEDAKGFRAGVQVEGGGKSVRIRGDDAVALDPIRGRIAVRGGATVHVHALSGGERIASYDLGESGDGLGATMAFAGDRLVVAVSAIVRVIDLATGAITPAGAPPYAQGELAVSAEGEVQCLGTTAVRIAGGQVVASVPLRGRVPVDGDPHQVARYGLLPAWGGDRVDVLSLGAPGPSRGWRVKGLVVGAWLGSGGGVVIARAPGDDESGYASTVLARASGARLERIAVLARAAWVQDVDVDAGYALIVYDATSYLVRLGDRSIARRRPHPGCVRWAQGKLERGGDRWLLHDGDSVVVYRRSTGALVGSADIDEAHDGQIAFIPGRTEILFAHREVLALWETSSGELRRLGGLAGLAKIGVSPDGRRVALSFHDGRVTLAELDVLRAAMTLRRAPKLPEEMDREKCEGGNPFEADEDGADPDAAP